MNRLDAQFSGVVGGYGPAIVSPDWRSTIAAQAATQAVPNAPDLGQGVGEAAAAAAAAGGIQNQKQQEAVDAMSDRYSLAPQADKIKRQFATADALRRMGSSLNTGSTGGAAPNWAGALANIAGAYMGRKQQDEAQAGADELGGKYRDIARIYFGANPGAL